MVTIAPADRSAAERRALFLNEASKRLASSLDPAQTLREVLALAVPAIADWGIVYVLRPDRTLERAAYLHSDPALQRVLEEMHVRWPDGPRVVGALAQVVDRGVAVLLDPVPSGLPSAAGHDAEHAASIVRLGLGAGVVAPLVARGEVLGILALTQRPGGRTFDADDIRLVEELGIHVGAAFESARTHDRLARLQGFTSRLTGPLDATAVAGVLVRDAAAAIGAKSAALALFDEENGMVELYREHATPEDLLRPFARFAIEADLPAAEVIRTGGDLFIPTRAELVARWSGVRTATLETEAWAVLALRDGARVFGAVWFGFATPRRFDAASRAFIRALADQASQALARARLAEAALVGKQLLESQNEATLDGIFFQDARGRTAFYNERLLTLFGVPADVPELPRIEDRLARSMEAIADPAAFVALAMRMETEPMTSTRFDLALRDGRILDAYTAPVLGPDGKRLGRAWYYRDATNERRLQRELVDARQQLAHREKLAAMGSLVSGVAHEIRTPLAYAANHAHLLAALTKQELGPRAAAIRESSEAILEATQRINRLVQDLRRFTRVPGKSAASACAPDEAANAAARLFEATHPGRVKLEADVAHLPPVGIERVQLQQILLNLLENAADASAPGGRIRLTLRAEEGRARFEVADEGPGIPRDVQERMWEPFFTTKSDGTGLGLSIVRRIVETHGGSVRCVSEPGKGTVFEVRLPTLPS